jgi:hypothetical protein
MEKGSKGRTRTQAGLSDAARPDERMGDDLDDLDDLDVDDGALRASSSGDDDQAPLLAEGEPVGPWSNDEDEDENAFDAAAPGDVDEDDEDEDEGASSDTDDEANQARFAGADGDDEVLQAESPQSRDRRRGR